MSNLTKKNLIKAYLQLVKVMHSRPPGNGVEIPRICGYLEACLQNEGVLDATENLPKKEIEYKIIFGLKRTKTESYLEMINRLCLKYINDNNIDVNEYKPDGYRYEIGDYSK